MIDKENADLFKETIDHSVAVFIKSIPRIINDHLEDVITQTLGFRKFMGRWEVDTNQPSPIAGIIVDRTRATVASLVRDVEWKPTEELVDAIYKKFESSFKYRLEELVREFAVRRATEVVAELEKKLTLPDLLKSISLKKISDPDFMNGCPEIRDVIMEALVDGSVKVM
jgi:hypothetical protein